MRRRSAEVTVSVPSAVALYVLNQKRSALQRIEGRYGFRVTVAEDNTLVPPAFRLDRIRALTPAEIAALPVLKPLPMPVEEETGDEELAEAAEIEPVLAREAGADETDIEGAEAREGSAAAGTAGERWDEQAEGEAQASGEGRNRRRRRRRRRPSERHHETATGTAEEHPAEGEIDDAVGFAQDEEPGVTAADQAEPKEAGEEKTAEAVDHKRRRRGRRGGRRRRHSHGAEAEPSLLAEPPGESESETGFDSMPEPAVETMPESEPAPPVMEETPEIQTAPTDAASSKLASHEVTPAELAPPPEEHAPAPTFEAAATSGADETPAEPESTPVPVTAETEPAEAERVPAAYNVPAAHEVSGPAPNPRRGWWRRNG